MYESFLLCIEDSTWFLKAFLCLSHFSFLVILEPFLGNFRGDVLEAFLCKILHGCYIWGPCATLLGDFAPAIPTKQLLFGGFRWSSHKVDLEGRLSISLDWVLGTELIAKGSLWGTLAIPKVSLEFMEWIRRSGKVKLSFSHMLSSSWMSMQNLPDRFRKLVWPVSQTSLTGLAPMGCCVEFWTGEFP
jgi:hypothetical protein